MTFIGAVGEPNSVAAFDLRPDVYEAWQQLLGAIKEGVDPRRYELATVAAARRMRSSYCMLAHGSVLVDKYMPPEVRRDLEAEDWLTPVEDVADAVVHLLCNESVNGATLRIDGGESS